MRVQDLITAQDEYIELLTKELNRLSVIANVHNIFPTPEDIFKGEELRKRIEKAKEPNLLRPEIKERVNYLRDGKYFVGYPVNISGVLAQAETLEELGKKIKIMTRLMLEVHWERVVSKDEPFEFVELEYGEWVKAK